MQILSMLAPLVLAYLGRQRQGGGTGANTGQTGGQGGPDLGSILGGLVGGGGLGSVLGGILGGGQHRAPAQPQSGSVLGGGSVLPGYPDAGAAQPGATGGSGDLFGTLNRALDGAGDGNALNDLIGLFGRRR